MGNKNLRRFFILPGLFLASTSIAADFATDTVTTMNLSDVVVTGTRSASNPSLLSQTVTIVGHSEIENSLRPSLLPVLTEKVPGLFTTARGVYGFGVSGGAAGSISVRGLSGSSAQVLSLIDGHPQYSGIFGHPISDAMQDLMAERVEVVRGPASTIYGSNAMGGVVNVITRKMLSDGMRTTVRSGYGSYNTLELLATNQLRYGRFSSTVSASYNRSDNNRKDMDFGQFSAFAKAAYDFSDDWKVQAEANVTRFEASNPGPVTRPLIDADQRVTRGSVALGIDNSNDVSHGGVSFFFNWGHHWINDGHVAGADPRLYRFISDDDMAGISLRQNVSLFDRTLITVGADWFRYSGEAWNKFVAGAQNGQRKEIVDKYQSELAAYIELRQRLGAYLTLTGGVRVDNNNGIGTEWIPKGGFSLSLPSEISLKGSICKGFRYPTLREMYMFGPANPRLKPESSISYEIGYSQSLLDGALDYGVNIFLIDAKNIIMTVPNPSGAGNLNMNSGKLLNKGVEAQVAYRINRPWSVDMNYSYVNMKHPVIAAPVHKLYAGCSFVDGHWNVSTGLQYIDGLYTSVQPVGEENFVLWNLRVQYQATGWLSLWARGENLLAQKYEINQGFPMPKATVTGGVKFTF